MFTTRIRLFRIHGIWINVDASWLIILALLTWTLSSRFGQEAPGLPSFDYLILGLATALAFFVCILLHELGHALAAQQMNIPIRNITLFLFGGVAEMEDEPPSAGKEFVMAIAGPIVSAILAAAFWVLAEVGTAADWQPPLVIALGDLAGINFAVLIFNVLPAFPLDGGRVFRAMLWGATRSLRRATYWASLVGQGFAWILIVLAIMSFFGGQFIGGLWLGLIGMFLQGAAKNSYQQVFLRQALRGEPIRRIMNPNPITVPPSVDLGQWIEDYVYRYHHKNFPVVADGQVEGMISTDVLRDLPRSEWPLHKVGEVMRRDLEAISLPPDADAFAALQRMQRTGRSRLLVTEGRRLVGLVSLKDLVRFLQLKSELDSPEDEGRSRPGGGAGGERLPRQEQTPVQRV